jgi:uncharacterized protein (TIGR00251 family)
MSRAISWQGKDLLLSVRLQPRASQNEIVGIQDDYIKVRLTAPPVDGKANTSLLQLLARHFGVAKSRVTLESGASSRQKRIRIQAPDRLPPWLTNPEK